MDRIGTRDGRATTIDGRKVPCKCCGAQSCCRAYRAVRCEVQRCAGTPVPDYVWVCEGISAKSCETGLQVPVVPGHTLALWDGRCYTVEPLLYCLSSCAQQPQCDGLPIVPTNGYVLGDQDIGCVQDSCEGCVPNTGYLPVRDCNGVLNNSVWIRCDAWDPPPEVRCPVISYVPKALPIECFRPAWDRPGMPTPPVGAVAITPDDMQFALWSDGCCDCTCGRAWYQAKDQYDCKLDDIDYVTAHAGSDLYTFFNCPWNCCAGHCCRPRRALASGVANMSVVLPSQPSTLTLYVAELSVVEPGRSVCQWISWSPAFSPQPPKSSWFIEERGYDCNSYCHAWSYCNWCVQKISQSLSVAPWPKTVSATCGALTGASAYTSPGGFVYNLTVDMKVVHSPGHCGCGYDPFEPPFGGDGPPPEGWSRDDGTGLVVPDPWRVATRRGGRVSRQSRRGPAPCAGCSDSDRWRWGLV